MASTTLIMTVLMAAMVSAGFSSSDDHKSPFGSKMFRFISPLPLPQLPGFSLPSPPPLLWPANFPAFPPFPSFPTLTIQDIANQGALPDSNYNGIGIVSQSSAERGPDGEIKRQGGSAILTNNNGQVTLLQTGKAPPVIVAQYTDPPFPEFPEIKDFMGSKFTMPTMKPFVFDIPTMKPFVIDPPKMLDPETIKNYVPGKNEKFQGSSYSSKSHYSNVDGVENSGAEATSMVNDNGKVAEEKLAFKKRPK